MSEAKRKREGDDAAEGSDDSSVEVFDVEAIRGKRKTRAGHIEYLIKWAGYSSDQNSWEREENLQCPEKLEEFNEAQRQKAAAKRARVPGSKTSGDDNSGSGAAIARSPVKSEGTGKDDAAAGRSPVLAKEKKSLENGDEIERIMGAKRNQLTSELELYIKWKGEPVMGWALAKEVRRKYPEMLIDFYESRLRVRSPILSARVLTLAQFPHKKRDDD